ncbi:hypothetical protein NXV85_11330 [Bacteroides fragilis]|nr:hypothetical protein [Bacteroides fragilis]
MKKNPLAPFSCLNSAHRNAPQSPISPTPQLMILSHPIAKLKPPLTLTMSVPLLAFCATFIFPPCILAAIYCVIKAKKGGKQ